MSIREEVKNSRLDADDVNLMYMIFRDKSPEEVVKAYRRMLRFRKEFSSDGYFDVIQETVEEGIWRICYNNLPAAYRIAELLVERKLHPDAISLASDLLVPWLGESRDADKLLLTVVMPAGKVAENPGDSGHDDEWLCDTMQYHLKQLVEQYPYLREMVARHGLEAELDLALAPPPPIDQQ